jgi:hypothetical protein
MARRKREYLARYEGQAINRKLWLRFPKSGAGLRFIDPYGDTVLNQAQIDVLAAAMDALLSPVPVGTSPAVLVAVRQFIDH